MRAGPLVDAWSLGHLRSRELLEGLIAAVHVDDPERVAESTPAGLLGALREAALAWLAADPASREVAARACGCPVEEVPRARVEALAVSAGDRAARLRSEDALVAW